MFDRFTDRARKAMALSYAAARRFQHDYIGTEHVFLGLLEEETSAGGGALGALGAPPHRIAAEVERLLERGTRPVKAGQLPFTPRAKRVLELSLEEASNLGHAHIGPEHLLLGLIRESEGVPAQVLRNENLNAEDVRTRVLSLVGEGAMSPRPMRVYGASARVGPFFTSWATTALHHAQRLAALRDVGVGPRHVLAALLILAEDWPRETGLAKVIGGDVDLPRLYREALLDADRGEHTPRKGKEWESHSPETIRVLASALSLAADGGRSAASEVDLLAALVLDPKSPASVWLTLQGIDVERIRRG